MATVFVLMILFPNGNDMEYGKYTTMGECMRELHLKATRCDNCKLWCEARTR